jgi:hypothetical protein
MSFPAGDGAAIAGERKPWLCACEWIPVPLPRAGDDPGGLWRAVCPESVSVHPMRVKEPSGQAGAAPGR